LGKKKEKIQTQQAQKYRQGLRESWLAESRQDCKRALEKYKDPFHRGTVRRIRKGEKKKKK